MAAMEGKLLGKQLVEAGLVNLPQLSAALEEQKSHGGRIGFLLVRMGFLSAEKLAAFLKQNPRSTLFHEELAGRQKAAAAFPRHLALYYKVAPIRLDGKTLTVAVSELEHPSLLQTITDVTGLKLDPLICPESEIRALLESSYALPTSDHGIELSSFGDNAFVVVDTTKGIKALAVGQLKNERDVGEWFRSIIAEAIKEKSREILLRPEASGCSVHFKKESFHASDFFMIPELQEQLGFLLFRLAKLDTLRQKQNQHGRFWVKVHGRMIILVVTATPTMLGTRFVLEMFDEKLLKHSYEELIGPFADLKARIADFLTAGKHGMLLITGPEGSGKTSFLYSLLGHCKGALRRIVTLENAVRYPLTGVIQKEVPPEEMAVAMEEIMGHDPDLVVIHPMQNAKVAETAFLLAARLPVIAVMPSFDCFTAIDWLCEHQLKSALKAGMVHTMISLRLIPRVCGSCSVLFEPKNFSLENVETPAGVHLRMNQGCDACRGREQGNADLFAEYFVPDPEAILWIDKDHTAVVVRKEARKAGRKTLFDAVTGDNFTEQFDMLAIMKLHSALSGN